MVSVEEALRIVFRNLISPLQELTPIEHAVGRILAEPVAADRDFPPFNRVTMDGIAIAYEAWEKGVRNFPVKGIQAAGHPQSSLQDPLSCVEIMTGAVLPEGADTVIRYEDVNIQDYVAAVKVSTLVKGQSIHPKGSDAKTGSVLINRGTVITPAEVALMASVGKAEVSVFKFPPTAVISTGDELVPVRSTPALHQVRQSNVYALTASMRAMGWEASMFHLPDDKSALQSSLPEIIANHEVLIFSGGVSKGKFDFLPSVFEAASVEKQFHEVSQRPGKPLWFGVAANGARVVFALPGNPVSTFVCFYRYIRPWMYRCMGVVCAEVTAILAEDVQFASPLTYYLQVSARIENGVLRARPIPGGGSGDFVNLSQVTGFLELPANRTHFTAGEAFPYFPFRP